MVMPMISLSVVTNGPVARAGFILKRFNVSGTKVPKNEAQRITVIRAKLTVYSKNTTKCG